MSLSDYGCIPCKGDGILPLQTNEIEELLKEVEDWEVINNSLIKKRYSFSNFKKALLFINKVGELAEEEKHHPDIEFGWGYCVISLQTHSIKGLHKNDFILAAKIDDI